MKTGRPRKPTVLKLVAGNPGKRAIPKNEPKPPADDPLLPATVAKNQIAREEWKRIVSLTTLKSARVLTVADAPMLEATVTAYARMREADAALAENGLTYESVTQGGGVMVRPRPEVLISSDAWKRYVAGLTHFGLSPSTRSKTNTVPDGDEAKDPAEGYF